MEQCGAVGPPACGSSRGRDNLNQASNTEKTFHCADPFHFHQDFVHALPWLPARDQSSIPASDYSARARRITPKFRLFWHRSAQQDDQELLL